MLKVNNLHKSFGATVVISDISFSLERGQKVALVGKNGSGKSTLLRLIAGVEQPDDGEIQFGKRVCVGYLPQDTSTIPRMPVREYLRQVAGVDEIERRMSELAENLDDSSAASEYGDLQETFLRLDGYAFDHRMEVMLSGFGLERVSLDQSAAELSSGQKSKVVLAGILLKGVDILLLDEPTNNLDLPALIWLEDFIQKSDAAALIVSHDRRFLDKVVRKVLELDDQQGLEVSGGTYSEYLSNKAKRLARQKEEYRLQQEEKSRLSDRVQRLRESTVSGSSWKGSDGDKFLRGFKRDRSGRSGKRAKSIEKRIDRMDLVEEPVEREPLKIDIGSGPGNGSYVLQLRDLVAGYESGFSIGPISLDISTGERVGIMGLNGSGKSTLLKAASGHLSPKTGSVEFAKGVRLGNMTQEHENLPREETMLAHAKKKTNLSAQEVFALLTRFGFSEGQIRGVVSALSPGERARFLLALFSAQKVNMLLLDEPTNHLDIEALEALEEALQTYEGSVLLVSHDRYFIEAAALDRLFVLQDGMLSRIPDYNEYVQAAQTRAEQLLRSM